MDFNPSSIVDGRPSAFHPTFTAALIGANSVNELFKDKNLIWIVGRPIAPAKAEIRTSLDVIGNLWLFSMTDLFYPFQKSKITEAGLGYENLWSKAPVHAQGVDECSGGTIIPIEGLYLPSTSYLTKYAIIVRRSNDTYDATRIGENGVLEKPFKFVTWVCAVKITTEGVKMGELLNFSNRHGNLAPHDFSQITEEFRNTDAHILADLRLNLREAIFNPIPLTGTNNEKFREIINLMANYTHSYTMQGSTSIIAHFVGASVAERLTAHECNTIISMLSTNPIMSLSYQRMVWVLLRACASKVGRYTIVQLFANQFRSFAAFDCIGKLVIAMATDSHCAPEKVEDAVMLWKENKFREKMFLVERYGNGNGARLNGEFRNGNDAAPTWCDGDVAMFTNQDVLNTVQNNKIYAVKISGRNMHKMQLFPWWWGEVVESVTTRLMASGKMSILEAENSILRSMEVVDIIREKCNRDNFSSYALIVTATYAEEVIVSKNLVGYTVLSLERALAYLHGKSEINGFVSRDRLEYVLVLRAEWCTMENICALCNIPPHIEGDVDAWTFGFEDLPAPVPIWLVGDKKCMRANACGFDMPGVFASIVETARLHMVDMVHSIDREEERSDMERAEKFMSGDNFVEFSITPEIMKESLVLWTWVPSASNKSPSATKLRRFAYTHMVDKDSNITDEQLREQYSRIHNNHEYHIPNTGEMVKCKSIGTGCYRAIRMCACTRATQMKGIKAKESNWMAKVSGDEWLLNEHYICCETNNPINRQVLAGRAARIEDGRDIYGDTLTAHIEGEANKRNIRLVCHHLIPSSLIKATDYCGAPVDNVTLICVRGEDVPLANRDVVALASTFGQGDIEMIALDLDRDKHVNENPDWSTYFRNAEHFHGRGWVTSIMMQEELWAAMHD